MSKSYYVELVAGQTVHLPHITSECSQCRRLTEIAAGKTAREALILDALHEDAWLDTLKAHRLARRGMYKPKRR